MNINLSDINMWLYGVASSLAGLVVLLVRKVLTSEKQIELIKQQVVHTENALKELKSDMREIRDDIKTIMSK